MPTRTVIKTISGFDRLRNSADGNARWLVKFEDGTSIETEPNASVAYRITNSDYRQGQVRITLTERGKIIDVEAISDSPPGTN